MDKSFNDALQTTIGGIAGCEAFALLYSPDMEKFKEDPWPAIQLAIAILLDKPIIVACLPGRTLPPKVAAIADKVVYGGPEELAEGIRDFMRDLS